MVTPCDLNGPQPLASPLPGEGWLSEQEAGWSPPGEQQSPVLMEGRTAFPLRQQTALLEPLSSPDIRV